MLVEKAKLKDIFEHMKNKVQATEGSVLICVAGEIDAMAAGHILTVCSRTPRLFFYILSAATSTAVLLRARITSMRYVLEADPA
jgi:hypothetical protein